MPRPQPTFVLHMTRVERLAGMVQEGLLSDTECRRRGITGVGIGYTHIKERRAHRSVPCGAGGTLADYVPWYFAPRSPMLFAITKGQVGEQAARTEEIVYVVSSTQRLREAGVTVVASDRHAVLQLARLSGDDADPRPARPQGEAPGRVPGAPVGALVGRGGGRRPDGGRGSKNQDGAARLRWNDLCRCPSRLVLLRTC